MTTSINVVETVAGSTIKLTWVNSGVTPSSITSELLDRTDAVVQTATPVSSLNGLYYALHTLPNTRAWYVNRWWAVINANTYQSRQFVRGLLPEVD